MKDRIPAPVAAAALVGAALVLLPIVSLGVKAPWSRLGELASGEILAAAVLSIWTSILSAAVALVAGTGLGWVIHRSVSGPMRLARALVLAPMVLPPVVGGIALLSAFGRTGLFPLGLAFTPVAVVLAQVFVSIPLVVLAVEAGLDRVPESVEESAKSLGLEGWTRARTITLPLLRPALVAAAALAWARSLGEFGATLAFAGSVAGRTRTLPVAAYAALQADAGMAVLLGCLLLVIAVATVAFVWVRVVR